MPTPFPGMDPYLERRGHWHAVHTRLLVAIADALGPQVWPHYRVDIALRTYSALLTSESRAGIPDVLVMSSPREVGRPMVPAPAIGIAPQVVEVPMPEEIHERYIHLLLQEASRRDITVTEDDLSRATVALRHRFKNLKSFGAWMKAQGLDDRSLREPLRIQLLTSRVMAALVAGVQLTEERMQGFYEAYKDDLKADEAVRLRVVAVQEKATAEELVTALQRGEDFDRLVQERSLEDCAAPGGDMGWASAQTLPPALRETVSTLKAGETGGPWQSGPEFLLVRVEERRPAHMMSLAEAQPQIKRRLLAEKQRKVVQTWLTEQEKQAKIEVLP